MEKMDLKQIQQCEFKILCFVDDFCKKNGIKYSLGFGTLIGAVRHKGFIPWDDDIDIIMTRENYDLFIQKMRTEPLGPYSLFHYDTNPKNPANMFAKVVDNNTIGIEPLRKDNSSNKVWIDVFPLDYVKKENSFTSKKAMLIMYILSSRYYHCSTKIKLLGHLFWFIPTKRLNSYADRYSKKATVSQYYQSLTFTTKSVHAVFPVNWFDTYQEISFCGRNFPVISEYDKLLKLSYGNYMELPPIEKRYSHSIDAYFIS